MNIRLKFDVLYNISEGLLVHHLPKASCLWFQACNFWGCIIYLEI